MLKYLATLDEHLLIYLNNMGTERWDSFWLTYTEKITHLPLMLVLAFLMYKVLGTKRFLWSLLAIAVMILLTDQLTNLAKHSFCRPRPCRVASLEGVIRYIAKRCGPYGYFSGHSSNSMALAIFIGNILRKKMRFMSPLLILWSLGMGYSLSLIHI